MVKLTVDNVFTTIEGADKNTELIIWEKLAFQVTDFEAKQIMAKYGHIEMRRLFNRKTKKTYTGLLEYVIEILDQQAIEYEIIDTRVKHEPNANFKLVEYLDDDKKIKLESRPYQKEIIDNANARECIQAATGAGKTYMMAGLIEKFNVKPVAVFADKLTLCSQLKSEFEKFLGTDVGIVGGGLNDKKDITVYSIQSATEDDVKDAKMIMFDECLTEDTLILLADGTVKTIKEIVKNKLDVEIVTYNIKKKIFEPKKIYNWREIPFKDKNKKLVRLTIEDENGSEHTLTCTEDHKIWIESENKYIEAGKLIKDMQVICYI